MSLRLKLVLGVVGIAFLVSGATGTYFYLQAKAGLYKSLREELKATATIAAKLVDGDKLQTLKSADQMDSVTYKNIQELMGKIAQSNEEFLYAYTMRKQKDKVRFIVDSPASDDNNNGVIEKMEQPADINEVYSNPPKSLLQGFVTPSSDPEPWHGKWGWTISGYSPIYNSQGKSVGLLGIDMSADRVDKKLYTIRRAGIVCLVLAVLLAISLTLYFSGQFVSPLKNLEKAMAKVGNGDYSVEVEYKKRDEIGRVFEYFNRMLQGLREKELLKKSLGKMVHRDVVEHMLENRLSLGGETVYATILVCDLRGFTRLSSQLPPKLLVTLLNEYFTAMVEIIERYGGIVDKFMGDSIMAVFGHPYPMENQEDVALDAAWEMLDACEYVNSNMQLQHGFVLENSIGLHSGHVLAGNIGSPDRMEYTFMGDAVNVAVRLEEETRELNIRLALSQEVCTKLTRDGRNPVKVGTRKFPGRSEDIDIFTC